MWKTIKLMCPSLSISLIAYSLSTWYITWHTPPITSQLRHVVYFAYSLSDVTSRDVCDQSQVGNVAWCTSPARNPLTPHTIASHRSVGGNTPQEQVHIAQLFGAKLLPKSTAFQNYISLFFGFTPKISGPAAQNGHRPGLSWTPVVTPFVPLSTRHKKYPQNTNFHSFSTFRAIFSMHSSGGTKGLNYRVQSSWVTRPVPLLLAARVHKFSTTLKLFLMLRTHDLAQAIFCCFQHWRTLFVVAHFQVVPFLQQRFPVVTTNP